MNRAIRTRRHRVDRARPGARRAAHLPAGRRRRRRWPTIPRNVRARYLATSPGPAARSSPPTARSSPSRCRPTTSTSSSASTRSARSSPRSSATSRSCSATPASRRSTTTMLVRARHAELRCATSATSSSARRRPATSCSACAPTCSRSAEDALGDQQGSVVVLNPRTGALIAMYSNPSVRPAAARRPRHRGRRRRTGELAATPDPSKPDLLPRAYRERYPPGSTFKIVDDRRSRSTPASRRPTRSIPVRTLVHPPQTERDDRELRRRSCGGTLERELRRSRATRRSPSSASTSASSSRRGMSGLRDLRGAAARPVARRGRRAAGPRPGSFETEHSRRSRSPASARATSPRPRCRWRWSRRRSPTAA